MRALSSPKWVVAIVNRECRARYCNRAIANALPSDGSVPAPTSSNKTKDLGIGHGAWGMGHGAWGTCAELVLSSVEVRSRSMGPGELVLSVLVLSEAEVLVIARFEFSSASSSPSNLLLKTSKMRLMRRM